MGQQAICPEYRVDEAAVLQTAPKQHESADDPVDADPVDDVDEEDGGGVVPGKLVDGVLFELQVEVARTYKYCGRYFQSCRHLSDNSQ